MRNIINTMRRGTKFLATTMAKANEVQSRYAKLGAPTTQRVRNPIPLHQLIFAVLPVLPHPDSLIQAKRSTRLTALGRTFVETKMEQVNAYDLLGSAYYEKNAISIDEVCEALQSKGFFALKGSVAVALQSYGIKSMRFTKPRTAHEQQYGLRRNSSYCRYFAVAQ